MIEMQTDDTLMLEDNQFAELEKKKLRKAKLTSKKREMLIVFTLIKFIDEMISLIEITSKNSTIRNDKNGYILSLTQFKQFDQIRLINISTLIDLIDS